MRRLLLEGMDMQAIWSIGHSADGDAAGAEGREILVFADRATLERLRKCDHLHEAGIALFVVTDGDSFEAAWGRQRLSGSLARWAWREAGPGQAYYDESHWAGTDGEAGTVVRVRRTAYRVWARAEALQSIA